MQKIYIKLYSEYRKDRTQIKVLNEPKRIFYGAEIYNSAQNIPIQQIAATVGKTGQPFGKV